MESLPSVQSDPEPEGTMLSGAAPKVQWKITYPRRITVGQKATLDIRMITEEPVDLHIAFRGRFRRPPNSWGGHWTYREHKMPLAAGTCSLHVPFTIPDALYVEREIAPKFRAQNYYFYVFACPPGRELAAEVPQQAGGPDGPWSNYSPSVSAHVMYPEVVRRRLPVAAVSMLADRIQPWDLKPETKRSLLAKLTNAAKLTRKAYEDHRFQPLNGAVRSMQDFVSELRSCTQAALSSPEAQECLGLANSTILWMIEGMRK